MAKISKSAYNNIVAQAAAKWISADKVAAVARAAGISQWAKSSWRVSQSQIAAGKQVAQNYSGWAKIVPNADKQWLRSWYTLPSRQNTNIPAQNISTPKYDLGNLWKNIFGDIRESAKWREAYTGEWIKLSTWNVITDKSAIPEMQNLKNYMKFGKEAEKIESVNKWFIAARNDAIIMDIFKNQPKITQENVDKIIVDYIKTQDTSGQLYTWSRWDIDVKNTLASIKSRMWYIPSEADLQKKDLTNKATKAFDREITDLKSQYDAEKSAFMKAWAIEDRYTNFNEVNDRVNSTLEAAGKHRMENLYTWMPTDQQISEIAQWLWQDFNTTKKILEWRWFEDLEMQWEFKEKSEREYTRVFEDMERNRSRAITDVETKHTRTQTALNEQIDNVKTEMERNIAIWEKAWALSGWLKSSWYMAGLENIRSDAIKNMDRLSLRKDWDTTDTAMIKWRIIDDYNTGMTRVRQDLETAMNDIKTKNWVAMSQYLNQYAPSSSELTRKLNELEDYFWVKSQEAFAKYTANLRWITDTMTYDTEKFLQLEWMKQQLQQTNVKNLLANNGMALAWINYWDLQTMLQSWDISPMDYTAMTWYMKTLWISSLQSMGTPTPQDLSLYNQLLEQWMTPQQAITTVTSTNPSRFMTTAKGWEWKWGDDVWMYFRTWANWQLEFQSAPDFSQQRQVPTNYTPANTSQMIEWLVFLDKYKEWQKWPRDWYCWQFVNDYLKSMWITNENLFIDPITEKAKYVNSQTPTTGSIMIMDSKTQPQYWHTAIVQSVNKDWTITLKESNWNWDWKIHIRTVDPNKMWVNVYWYFDPTKQWWFIQQWQQLSSKEVSLALISKWWLTKTDQQKIAKQAIREWRWAEFNKALKQWAVVDMSPTQITQYNKEYDRFQWNQVVKWFEEWLTQFKSLAYALSDKSWPWDMAWVFAFMKTFDPSSVVREPEFKSAAESAWVVQYRKNTYDRLMKWKVLTPEQAEVFKKIAIKFIKARWQSYDRLYANLENAYKQFGIPESLLPIKATDQLYNFLEWWAWTWWNNDPLWIR